MATKKLKIQPVTTLKPEYDTVNLIHKIMTHIHGIDQPIWRVIDMDCDNETLMNLEDILTFHESAQPNDTLLMVEELMNAPVGRNVKLSMGWIVKRQPMRDIN